MQDNVLTLCVATNMEGQWRPVLVIFDLDLSQSTYGALREKLNELGVANTHQLCRSVTLKTSRQLMLSEIWPCRSCEEAFRNNILPLLEAMGIRVTYSIYPIRNPSEFLFDDEYPQTRWTLCN